MTESNPSPGEEPTLKLPLRSKPATDVETSVGRVYLYPLRVRDMTDFEKLEPGDAVSFRASPGVRSRKYINQHRGLTRFHLL